MASDARQRATAELITFEKVDGIFFKMAGHGGRREGAGRKRGVPNRVPRRPNKDPTGIRVLARAYTPNAIGELAKLGGLVEGVEGAASDSARVSALKTILNRGYGQPARAIDLIVTPEAGSSLTDTELEQIASSDRVTGTD